MHAQAPLSPGYLGAPAAGAPALGPTRPLGGPRRQFWEIRDQMARRLMVFRHSGSACTSRQDARGRGRGLAIVAWRHYLGVGGVSDAAVTCARPRPPRRDPRRQFDSRAPAEGKQQQQATRGSLLHKEKY